MNSRFTVRLTVSPEQDDRLRQLQEVFSQACNALARLAVAQRCWNRVALHHLAYHSVREQFPALGSQMVCNAIYSVSRMARFVFQNPQSPWCIDKSAGNPLPLFAFLPNATVYFDRHTLSIRGGKLSMFSLDGRLQFHCGLRAEEEQRFRSEKLKEIVLSRDDAGFYLGFRFGEDDEGAAYTTEMPEYVVILEPERLPA